MTQHTATILIRNRSGLYQFEMRAVSGDIVLRGDTFPSEIICRQAIQLLQQQSVSPVNFEKKNCPGPQYAFMVKDTNNNILATSDGYWSIGSRDYAMRIVQRECATAEIKLSIIEPSKK